MSSAYTYAAAAAKLTRRGFTPTDVNTVLGQCADAGLTLDSPDGPWLFTAEELEMCAEQLAAPDFIDG